MEKRGGAGNAGGWEGVAFFRPSIQRTEPRNSPVSAAERERERENNQKAAQLKRRLIAWNSFWQLTPLPLEP